jgi:acetyl-CoA carboxylase biotin carboxyl carrier protein
MDIKEIEQLISVINKSSITEVEIEREGVRVLIKRETPTVVTHSAPSVTAAPQVHIIAQAGNAAQQVKEDDSNSFKVESPIVGTFYRKSSPDAAPFVEVGTAVKKGDTLCIVEAMKLMNEIEADVDGIVDKILVKDGSVVEYGEVLFHIRPA